MRNSAVIDGVRIPYDVAGQGLGLVLVHGTGPGAGIAFGHLFDRFAEHFRVVMPDLSGSATVEDGGVEPRRRFRRRTPMRPPSFLRTLAVMNSLVDSPGSIDFRRGPCRPAGAASCP